MPTPNIPQTVSLHQTDEDAYAGYSEWLDFVASCEMADAVDEAAGEVVARGYHSFDAMMSAAEREARDV